MNKLFIAALLLLAHATRAQSLSPTVVASGGRFAQAGGYSLSYTVGEETAIKTVQADNHILTQGFQQPEDVVDGITQVSLPNMEIKLYPNPAGETVGLWVTCLSNTGCANLRVTMHDLLGREIKVPTQILSQGNETQYVFKLNALAASVYFVRLQDESGNAIKTIKFTKTSL